MNPENFRGYIQENFRGYTGHVILVHPLEFSGDTCGYQNRKYSGDIISTMYRASWGHARESLFPQPPPHPRSYTTGKQLRNPKTHLTILNIYRELHVDKS